MTPRIKARTLLSAMALALSAGIFFFAASTAMAESKSYFVDMLYLAEGKTTADAKAYFDKSSPILAKHGMSRLMPGFVITEKLSGEIEPNVINVWEIASPDTFDKIYADPAYLKIVPLRDSTFDMSRSHMFMMKDAG